MYGEMEAQRGLATWPESHSQGVPEQGFKPWGKRTHRMFKMWVKRLKLSPHASDMGRVARGAGAEAGALQLSWPCGLAMLAACVLSCVHVCHTTDCCPPSSSDHGIFQARRLEWVTFSCSRGSSRPRDRTQVSHIASRHFNLCTTREAHIKSWGQLK